MNAETINGYTIEIAIAVRNMPEESLDLYLIMGGGGFFAPIRGNKIAPNTITEIIRIS